MTGGVGVKACILERTWGMRVLDRGQASMRWTEHDSWPLLCWSKRKVNVEGELHGGWLVRKRWKSARERDWSASRVLRERA